MPIFFYKAKNLKGEKESGFLSAQSPSHLSRILRRKGYFLISAEKKGSEKKRKIKLPSLVFFEKFIGVSLSEKLFFTRNLRVMIKTGISLPRAFKILSNQAKDRKFKKALETISEKIAQGESLSNSLGIFPEIFSNLYQETLKVGEETGSLESSLKVLSDQMEKEYNLKSKIKTAMLYPLIVLGLALVMGIFMFIFIVPNLKAVFEDLDIELPFATKIIFALADFMINNWVATFLIIGLSVFGLFAYFKSEKGEKFKSRLILKLPIISKITKQTNSALSLRTLSSLLKAGVPIVRALEITSRTLTNFYFRESLEKTARVVEKGEKLSRALSPYKNLYLPMVSEMIEIGEETGETSDVLEGLADFYEEEVMDALQKLSSTIEPILILIIGGVVGFFAVSMFQPIYSIMGGL
jgi:type IV pilus assembly protein PilC